jgi:hypothetical protein
VRLSGDGDGKVDGGSDDGEEEPREAAEEGEDDLKGEGEGVLGGGVVGCEGIRGGRGGRGGRDGTQGERRVSGRSKQEEREGRDDAQIIPRENRTSRNLPNASSHVGTSPLKAAAAKAAPMIWIRTQGR